MAGVKKAEPKEIVEVVADKGYEDTDNMVSYLEKRIIPHVITDDGKDGYEMKISYEKRKQMLHQYRT